MSRIVKALCEKEVFDNATGTLYYPGKECDIDLDGDAVFNGNTLNFRLEPKDRDYAKDSRDRRKAEKDIEKKEADKWGFDSIYEFRKYKELFGIDKLPEKESKTEQAQPEVPEPVVEKPKPRPKYPCPKCDKVCSNPQALKKHMQVHGRKSKEATSAGEAPVPPPEGAVDELQPSTNL